MTDILVVTLTVGQLTSLISEVFHKELKVSLPPPEVKFLNSKECAALLRCSEPTMRGHIKKGNIKKFKFGKKTLFKLQDVEGLAIQLKSFKKA